MSDIALIRNADGLWDIGLEAPSVHIPRPISVPGSAGGSNDLPPATWRQAADWVPYVGTASVVNDATGIDGQSNGAVTITDTATNSRSALRLSGVQIGPGCHVATIAVAKNQSLIPGMRVLLSGGVQQIYDVFLDTGSGAISADSASATVEDIGGWWLVSVAVDNSGGNTMLYLGLYPSARSTLNGTNQASLTGSCTVDWPMVNVGQATRSRLIAAGMSEPGYPFVAGAGQSGGALVVGGLAESSVGLLLAGQHVSVGGSFYTLTADVDSDQFGRATLAIAPDLRAVPADRTPVSFLSDSIESGAADLGVDAGLHTAVVLSLICDAAAEAPAGSERRGWWADAYAEVDGDRFGSHDWLLRREKQTSEVLLRAEDSARKALGWMIEDGIASRVDVAAAWSDTGDLERKITVVRPDASQLEISIDNAWRNT